MLQIKSKKSVLECNCTLSVTDITGVKVSPDDTGYTKSGEPLADNTDFHINDGVLINITYTVKDGVFKTSNDAVVKPNGEYISTEIPNFYTGCLPIDGMHNSLTVFIMTKSFFEAQPADWFDTGKGILFYEPENTRLVYRSNGQDLYIETLNGIAIFLNTLPEDAELQGISLEADTCYTICNLLACRNAILQEYLDLNLGYDKRKSSYKCPGGDCSDNTSLKSDMEFLRSAISVLRYLIQCKQFEDSDRILTLLSKCGNICSKYPKYALNNNQNGCGCK